MLSGVLAGIILSAGKRREYNWNTDDDRELQSYFRLGTCDLSPRENFQAFSGNSNGAGNAAPPSGPEWENTDPSMGTLDSQKEDAGQRLRLSAYKP